MSGFKRYPIRSLPEFFGVRQRLKERWAFRGQGRHTSLRSSLELACSDLQIPLTDAPGIELQIVREFKRQYDGSDHDLVMNDLFYCLSLMRHYGAPARFLDWTYSFYVAAFFAAEVTDPPHLVWAINEDWCLAEADRNCGEELSRIRNSDRDRNDATFQRFYMASPPRAFVSFDNPMKFHRRQIIQQGVFLCPGDVSRPFEYNLKGMHGWNEESAVVQFYLEFCDEFRRSDLIEELHRMNISRATLFPGLDGFAQSLRHRMLFFQNLAARGIGNLE